jgi:putative transcriptional regulator
MYHYRESGLSNVWLANGFDEHDTPLWTGHRYPYVEGLHRAIAHGIVNKGGKLTRTELRFLRQEMGLSQAMLATMLGNEAQTVALWEKRGGQPKIADRFIRAIYRELNEDNAHICVMIERLVDSDLEETDARITLEQDSSGWKVAA